LLTAIEPPVVQLRNSNMIWRIFMPERRSRTVLNVIFFVSALGFCVSVDGGELSFTGVATDVETGELAYTERHQIKLNEQGEYMASSVRYLGPDGQVFALKELDFSSGLLSPTLEFIDPRTDQRFSTRKTDGDLVLKTVESGEETIDRIEAELDNTLVVDAGFDQLLLSHWESLIAGEEKAFDFLALTRGSTIEFEVALVDLSGDLARFKVEPANWVINLLVDPIILDYDVESRRLVRYEGITNIAKVGTDRNYSAVIEYSYDDEPSPLVSSAKAAPPSS
jgi:hypothetical protein